MDVVQPVQQLLHHFLDLSQAELDHHVGEEASQIVLAKVKHQVEGGSVAIVARGFGTTDFYEINDVFVFEQLQDTDLAEGCDGELDRQGGISQWTESKEEKTLGLTPSFSFSISTFFIATNLLVVEFFSRALNTSL